MKKIAVNTYYACTKHGITWSGKVIEMLPDYNYGNGLIYFKSLKELTQYLSTLYGLGQEIAYDNPFC